MENRTPEIVIIILNWNRSDLTINAINSIKSNQQVIILVVDNGSDDDSARKLSKIPGVDLLLLNKNNGFTGGNNIAMQYSIEKYSPKYIILLNNDAVAHENAIDTLYDQREIADIISPKIYYPDKKTIWSCGGKVSKIRARAINRGQGREDIGQYSNICDIDFASGCAMWVRTEVVKNIGLLDRDYIFYYEDVDFCQRAKANGYSIKFLPEAVFVHWESTSAGVEFGLFKSKYRWRNRIMFAKKNLSKPYYLFFRLIVFPMVVIYDTGKYILQGRIKELTIAYNGLFIK